MLEKFFSVKYTEQDELFRGLNIWEDEKYRKLQGTYPVISLSFANVKGTDYEKIYFRSVNSDMKETTAEWAIHRLSDFLSRYYGKKVSGDTGI